MFDFNETLEQARARNIRDALLDGLLLGARLEARPIDVLDAQEQPAAAAAHRQPGQQEAAGVAQMQHAGRAGRQTADHVAHVEATGARVRVTSRWLNAVRLNVKWWLRPFIITVTGRRNLL